MKRLLLLGLIGGALAVAGWYFTRHRFCDCELAHSAACGDTGCWFRREFDLDAKTCAAIDALEKDFAPVCARHCADVATAVSALRAPGLSEDEKRAAAARLAEAASARDAALEAHVGRIAALMPREAAEHYLAVVRKHFATHVHAHDGAAR